MGKTDIYSLQYLEPYQPTGLVLDIDELRFKTIENQTFALYSIFGNGIIPNNETGSWLLQLSASSTDSRPFIQVSPGTGHVGFTYAFTTESVDIELIAPLGSVFPVTFYIYAMKNSTTASSGSVDFITSSTTLDDPYQYVCLGTVIVNYENNKYSVIPTTTGRIEISLYSTIGDIINQHVHIGGNYNPPPINLGAHVQGKLSGDNIENLDLDKVTKGTLAPERLPLINHDNLLRNGTLTHSNIDSLMGNLFVNSDSRLSEIMMTDLLQLAIAIKKHLGFQHVDETLINDILYIPGISYDAAVYDRIAAYYANTDHKSMSPFVPSDVELATISTVDNEIVGTNPASILSGMVTWTTAAQFTDELNETYNANKNVEVLPIGSVELTKPLNYGVVSTENISGWKSGYKITDTLTITDDVTYKDNYEIERYFFYEFTDSTTDLQIINALKQSVNNLGIGYNLPQINGSDSHPGQMYLYFILNSSSNAAVNIRLSDNSAKSIYLTNEVLFHPSVNGYSKLSFSDFGFETHSTWKSNIKGIGIKYRYLSSLDPDDAWDKQKNWFELNSDIGSLIDTNDTALIAYRDSNNDAQNAAIFVWNDSLYNESETIYFKWDANYNYTDYNSVILSKDVPAGTSLQTYVKIGNTSDLSLVQEYELESDELNVDYGIIHNVVTSGQTRYIEIKIVFTSDGTRTVSPVLEQILLNYEAPLGGTPTKSWSTANDWAAGVSVNVNDTNSATLAIKDELIANIGRYIYIKGNNIYSCLGNNAPTTYVNTSLLYATPWQVFNQLPEGLISPCSMVLKQDGNVIVVDRQNDRILELDNTGQLIKAIQGNIRLSKTDKDFVVLTAHYNLRLNKIWITFSQKISASIDKTKINLTNNQSVIQLNSANFTLLGDSTLQIALTDSQKLQLSDWINNGSPTNPIQIIIDSSAVICAGSNTITNTGFLGIGGFNTLSESDIPDYLLGPPTKYKIDGKTVYTDYSGINLLGALTRSLDGSTAITLPNTDNANVVEGDFDGDGSVSNETTSVLMGPKKETGAIALDLIVGEVVFTNLYAPHYVQLINDGWLVTATEEYSVMFFNDILEREWSIPSTVVQLYADINSAAWELSNGQVAIAAPASLTLNNNVNNGKILIVDRTKNNSIISSITISNGDAARVIPNPSETEFWVAVNDRLGNGANSRIIRINSRGELLWKWDDNGILKHPTDLHLFTNNTILVSE